MSLPGRYGDVAVRPFRIELLAIESAAVADEQALCHGLEMAGVSRGLRPLGARHLTP